MAMLPTGDCAPGRTALPLGATIPCPPGSAMLSRRRLLATTGLTATAVLGLGSRPARAFREEPATVEDVWAVQDARRQCRAVSSHDQMLAVLRAELAGASLTEQERQRLMATATCPTCGLLLAG